MENHSAHPHRVAVISGDPELIELVQAGAAAVGAEVSVTAEASDPARDTAVVVIGLDRVEQVAESGLLPGVRRALVGRAETHARLCAWSAPLDATVIVLPEGTRWLTGLLAGRSQEPAGSLVGLLGASGGVGASTLAVGVAQAATAAGRRCALVDLDPLGGGLDLLVRAERAEGWRWPQFGDADGYLGDLSEQLITVEGIDVLSMPREQVFRPHPEATAAVLRSLGRTHDLVLVDLPREPSPATTEAIRHCAHLVLVVGSQLRALAAARQTRLRLAADPTGVITRDRRTVGLSPETIADTLGLPLLAGTRHDPALPRGAERGDPPYLVASRRWRRTCDRLAADWLAA
ncbi:septum site-determining protein Ssd [Granulicoccus phenolivorans]|uniref:septum site-determining protein Ssd n=1 Tax=Granulicoccus phenolivorans TaxID=266854 RepID=UPI00138B18F0|nr:septum site-determining protein Ssd [Granulicoccus phenolivorans]